MNTERPEVVVIGGGISGLTTAWHLKRAGVTLRLLEAGPVAGGCVGTTRRDGFLLEKGPFNVIVRDPSFESLLEHLADELNVVPADESARKRFIFCRGRLRAVPTNPFSLMTSGLLSVAGRFRLLTGLMFSRRAAGEETIEQAAIRRFGREVADTLVSAVVSGIFAGDIGRLSLASCFPSAAEVDAGARSLMACGLMSALRRKGSQRKRRWRGLVSIDGGLGAITEAVARQLGDALQCQTRVTKLRSTGEGYDVACTDASGLTTSISCDRVVLATPAQATANLLKPIVPDAASTLATLESGSVVVLNLAIRRKDVAHPMDGFGFLVPRTEKDCPFLGVLWADSVFPHHAPNDQRLLRVFVGGSRDPNAITRSDDDLVSATMATLRDVLGITGEPTLVDVQRHRQAIPQYHIGHREKIERVRLLTAARQGLHLVGNYLDGVSLNDCVGLATRVANDILASISGLAKPTPDDHTLHGSSVDASNTTTLRQAGAV